MSNVTLEHISVRKLSLDLPKSVEGSVQFPGIDSSSPAAGVSRGRYAPVPQNSVKEIAVGSKELAARLIHQNPSCYYEESDWISSHPEPTQDFEQFYHDRYRSTPTSQKSAIYVQPIGSFGDSKVSPENYLKWLKDYCEAFYYGLMVKILDPVPVSQTACAFRVNEYTHNLQIHAGDLLQFLKKRKPRDAFCIVGITMIDLYPKESWNFVFGQASLTEGMGIFSFARYDSDFYSASYKGRLKSGKKYPVADYSVFSGYYTPAITSLLLLRSCKTLTHEIGHIFGLRHCQWLQCVMQGSNHLEESDRRPLDLCPICLRKLQSAIRFNIAERYKALLRWMDDVGSGTEAEFGHAAESCSTVESMVMNIQWAEP
ncbi:archaemetzincin-2 [Alligator mississippiensis]|uniref:Archaemetzincin-2 n=1 Tax=Alligator mississippiensis TaxID=8496 RepID=A0A151N2F6_ALLMI|nr:archaemetzincin-2 [Alligator mississippiensis]